MDAKQYIKLKQQRRSLEDQVKQEGRTPELMKRLKEIKDTLQKDPPNLAAIYTTIGE